MSVPSPHGAPAHSGVAAAGMLATAAAWLAVPTLIAGQFSMLAAVLLVLLTGCLLVAPSSVPAGRTASSPLTAFLTGCLVGLVALSLCLNTAILAVKCYDYAVLRLADWSVDGRELAKMAAIAQGGTMYPDMTDYPYFITLYTPLYHSFGAALSFFAPDAVVAGHWLIYAAHLALVGLLTLWMRAESGRFWPSLALALALVLGPYYGTYVLKTRPDLLAWLFAFGAAFFLSRSLEDRSRTAGIVWAALLASLALLTKQQTLPVVIALSTAFVVRRGAFAACLRFAVLALAFSAAIYGGFFLATGGDIVLHTITYPYRLAADPSVTNFANALPRLADIGRSYWALLLLYLLALVDDLRRRRLHLLDWMALVQLPFLIKLLSTWGADTNYSLGILLILGLRAGIFLVRASTGPWGAPVYLAGLVLLLPGLPGGRNLLTNRPDPAALAEAAALREIAAAGQTLVNSEGSAPFLIGDRPTPVYFFDVADMGFFEHVKLFDFTDSRLGRDIADKRFDRIILSQTFIVSRYLRHIQSAYDPVRTIGVYTVYEPRPGRLLALPDLEKPTAAGDIRLTVAAATNMEFVQAFDARRATSLSRETPGVLTLRLDSDRPMESVALVCYPKVHPVAEGNALEVAWSVDGTTFTPLVRYAGTGKDTDTELFEPALAAAFAPGTTTAHLRFTFYGTAQLWSNDITPTTLTIRQPGTK